MDAFTSADELALRRSLEDLFHPQPWRYWTEVLGSALVGYGALAVGLAWPGLVGTAVAVLGLGLSLHRNSGMLHELAHLSPTRWRWLMRAWNALWGVPLLLPSWVYRRIHLAHHRAEVFATALDPEYTPLAGEGRPAFFRAVLVPLALPLALALRFLLVAPLSWLVPPLRRVVLARASTLASNGAAPPPAWSPAERRAILVTEACAVALWWSLIGGMAQGVVPARLPLLVLGAWLVAMVCNQVRGLTAHFFVRHPGRLDPRSAMLESTTLEPGGLLGPVLFPLGLGYHALHHLAPAVPFHHLARAHARLVEALPPSSPYRHTVHRELCGVLRQRFDAARPGRP
jgi:fatty acid desaturase